MSAEPAERRAPIERLMARLLAGAAVRPSVPVLPCALGLVAAAVAVVQLGDNRRWFAAASVLFVMLFGGFLTAVWDRDEVAAWRIGASQVLNVVAEGVAIVAASFWAREHQGWPAPLAVGFLAFGGGLLLSYARTRIQASAKLDLADGPWGLASREVRLLVLAAGLVTGQVYWALVAIAVLTNAAVLGHLVRLRLTLRG